MLPGALEADVDSVIDGDPLRPGRSALEALIVFHVAQSHTLDGVEYHLA